MVECQGACVNAPMVMIFKDTYEDLTPERLAEIIDAFEAGKGDEIAPGPQIDRYFSAPVGGATTLTEEVIPAVAKRTTAAKAKTEPAKKPAAKAAPKNDSGTKATPAAKPKVVEPKAADVSDADEKNRPPAVDKPAVPDDLKRISGVGPKLEGVLNGLGIYTFAQISKWKKAEREWVDGYLRFKGRIERDEWVKQAKQFAKESNN